MRWLRICAALVVLLWDPHARASSNGLALTPPMGWNSWNHFGCSGLNETVVEQTATAMVSSGMQASGYRYINLDDCWMAPSRDANGNLVPDVTKFPSGMPALVSYIHNLGLKIGLYEDVGTATCQGRPGSYGYYQQDADTFAAWGIDYIKLDWCNTAGLDPQTQYTQFQQALASAGGSIVFSLCDWGTETPWIWAPAVGNLWRTTGDIGDNWLSMVNNMQANSAYAGSAGPGAWNDPDMLEVGNGGMTDTEDRTHFSMWAMMAAPLIAGNDLTALSPASLTTLTNQEVIAVDQDALGRQGVLLSDNGGGLQVWAKQVTGGTAVTLLNLSGTAATISVNWGLIGLESNQTAALRDLWAHADLGAFTGSFSANVPSHGVTMIMVGASVSLPLQTIYEGDSAGNVLSGQAVVMQCTCLDGNEVGYIGNDAANSVTINDVNAPSSGAYQMNIYGAVSGTRTFLVSVDGGAAPQANLTGTSFSLSVTSGMAVQLAAGANTIEFSNPDAWAPNLDHIVVSSPGAVAPGFNIAYPAADVTIASVGQSGTVSINLVPSGGFTGNVALACVLPAAMTGAGCSSTGANLSGTASVAAAVTITTTPPASAAVQPARTRSDLTRELLTGLLPVPGVALVWFGLGFRSSRRRKLLSLLSFWMVAALAIQFTACGGGGSGSGAGSCVTVPGAPGELSTASITASGTQLSWAMGGAASNCTVAGYTVYENSIPIAKATGASYSVAGLSASTTYSFSVTATDSYGASAQSAPLNVTTASAAGATPPGTYPVQVIATSAGVTQTANFNVIVE